LAIEAERLLDDPSPLVRAMAVWALARLGVAGRHAARATAECDTDVLAEWAQAMAA
jgi:epoxyqueuosine reductase